MSLLLGIKVLLSFANGYFIGNLGLLEFSLKKSFCVCKSERDRELTLDFIFIFFLLCRFYQVSQICT